MFQNRVDDGFGDESGTKGLPKGLNEKKGKHQLIISSIYNKAIMLHLSPQTGEVQIHELDPQMTFKYSQSIILPNNALH